MKNQIHKNGQLNFLEFHHLNLIIYTFPANIDTNFGSLVKLDNSNSVFQTLVDKVQVYPNPAYNYLSINNKLNKKIKRIQITSLDGKLIKDDVKYINSKIDISELPQGLYLLHLTFSDNTCIVKKFIKK